jgi:hypothetical protein
MITPKKQLMNIVEKRLNENWKSFSILLKMEHYGNCISIMCQELDQYIKLLYLVKQPYNIQEQLISCSINDKKWNIVDQDIENFAKTLTGWEADIYEFRNIFYRITINFNYLLRDPIHGLNESERKIIHDYIKEYHDQSIQNDYTIKELIPVFPMIFQKISDSINDYFGKIKMS